MTNRFPRAIRDALSNGMGAARMPPCQKLPDLKECHTMKKDELIKILKKVLETDATLDFLKKLEEKEIETLVACVRDKVDQG